MKEKLRNNLEYLPLLLVIESIICFFLSLFDFYSYIYNQWEEITECSILMCVVLYLFSDSWNHLSKKCLITLFLLNLLNFCYESLDTLKYYFIFQSVIYAFLIFLIIYQACQKKYSEQ